MATGAVLPIRHPKGETAVPGSPGWRYQLDPPRILKSGSDQDDKPRPVLEWCPVVSERLVTLREDGTTGATYYRLTVGEDTLTASHEEVTTHKIWHRVAMPGTGARNMRDLLTNIIAGQAARLPRVLAVTRTGWHVSPEGGPLYVYPDGRTWPESGRAHLISPPERLAMAAGPVEPVEALAVRAALAEVVERGGWAPLFGIGAGARSLGQSIRPVTAALVVWGDPNTGKTCTATAGRMLMLSAVWPPVVTARFNDTQTDLECAVDFEADMPTLIDDLALTADASQIEQRTAREMLERIIRPVGNGEAIRGRRKRDMSAQDRRYVRSIPVITAQQLPRGMQASLYRRAVVLRLTAGDAHHDWWKPEDKGGHGGALRCGPALRTIGEAIVARLGTAEDPGALLGAAERAALAVLGPEVDKAAPGWERNADGLSGVVMAAAAMLSGLILVAEAAGVEAAPMLAMVAGPLARLLAAQADTMDDRREATDDLAAAVGDIIRRALMDRRAHVADAAGDLGPGRGPGGLTANEMGLRSVGRDAFGLPAWEGVGPTLYWLPDKGGVGIRSTALADLVRANGDPRAAGYTSRSLGAALLRADALIKSRERGRETSHQVRFGAELRRLLVIRPDVIWTDLADGPAGPGAEPVERAPEPGPAGPDAAPEPVASEPEQQAAGTLDFSERATPAESLEKIAGPGAEVVEAAHPIVEPGPAGPILGAGADLDGIYLGDGRTLDPAGAYADMPAFLDRIAELMGPAASVGVCSVAISADLARALGYPAGPENARPGGPSRAKKATGKTRQECPAVTQGRAGGWTISDRGIGAWTVWRSGDLSVAVAVLDWLDHKAMRVASFPVLRADHDPMTAGWILARYRELTGVALVMTAGTSGTNILRGSYTGAGPKRRTPRFKWAPEQGPGAEVQEAAVRWTRPLAEWTEAERAASHVIGWDRRAAYLSGLITADLAYDPLEPTGVEKGFQPRRAGYWLVSGGWRPYPQLPDLTYRDGSGPRWLATPTVRELIAEGMPEEMILDAVLAPDRPGRGPHTGRATRAAGEAIRDAWAATSAGGLDPDEIHIHQAIKATYRELVGTLSSGTPFVQRNDWADAVVAESRAALLRDVIAIGRTGRWPVALDTDCAFYTCDSADPAAGNPGLLTVNPKSPSGLGTYVPKHVMTMADYLTQKG